MKIKFNIFGYEVSANITVIKDNSLYRIINSIMTNMDDESRRSKILMVKYIRNLSKQNPEWFESLGYELYEAYNDLYGEELSYKYMSLGDAKSFAEEHFEFEKPTRTYNW